jgi:hypothetical protein
MSYVVFLERLFRWNTKVAFDFKISARPAVMLVSLSRQGRAVLSKTINFAGVLERVQS